MIFTYRKQTSPFLVRRTRNGVTKRHSAYDVVGFRFLKDIEPTFKNINEEPFQYFCRARVKYHSKNINFHIRHQIWNGKSFVYEGNHADSTADHFHLNIHVASKDMHYFFNVPPANLAQSNSLSEAINSLSNRSKIGLIMLKFIKSNGVEGVGIDPGDGLMRYYGFDQKYSDGFMISYLEYLLTLVADLLPYADDYETIATAYMVFNYGSLDSSKFTTHFDTWVELFEIKYPVKAKILKKIVGGFI